MQPMLQLKEMSDSSQWCFYICAIYLGVLALIDMRTRKLPVWMLAAGTMMAILYQIVYRENVWILLLGGALVGVLFLGVGKVTQEAMGYGDGWLILSLGIFLGFWNLLCLLVCAFLLAAVFALGILAHEKLRRNVRFPFVPFLFLGQLCIVLTGGF